ncbi:MAG TPA: hypothetical protein VGC64_06530, partial [Pyrinomonadaceae bacterium]
RSCPNRANLHTPRAELQRSNREAPQPEVRVDVGGSSEGAQTGNSARPRPFLPSRFYFFASIKVDNYTLKLLRRKSRGASRCNLLFIFLPLYWLRTPNC